MEFEEFVEGDCKCCCNISDLCRLGVGGVEGGGVGGVDNCCINGGAAINCCNLLQLFKFKVVVLLALFEAIKSRLEAAAAEVEAFNKSAKAVVGGGVVGVVAVEGGGVRQQQSLSESAAISFKSSTISIDCNSLTIFCFFFIFTKGSNIFLCLKEIFLFFLLFFRGVSIKD